MTLPQRPQAVVFDLDGTLIDSAGDLGAAGNRLLAELGRRPLEDAEVRRFIGDGARRYVERALEATGASGDPSTLDDLTARFIAHYESDLEGHTKVFPGAREILAALKAEGLRVGICTNKPQRATERVLAALGLAAPVDAIAGGDRFAVRKPDPGHLTGLLAELDVAAGATVMVGDNEHDMAVARGAGTGAVLVSYGYARRPLTEIDADARIDHLDALPALLGLET